MSKSAKTRFRAGFALFEPARLEDSSRTALENPAERAATGAPPFVHMRRVRTQDFRARISTNTSKLAILD